MLQISVTVLMPEAPGPVSISGLAPTTTIESQFNSQSLPRHCTDSL